MRATLKIEAIVSTDADQKNLLWKENDDTLNTVIRDDLTVENSGVATLAIAATFAVPFGDVVGGRILKISTDASIVVTLNGAAAGLTVVGDSSYRGLLALHGEFTSISILCGAAAANVRYCIVGI